MKWEIVKVQQAVASNVENPPVLIYAKDRSRAVQVPIPARALAEMGRAPKAFFYAVWSNDAWAIGEPAPWQDW